MRDAEQIRPAGRAVEQRAAGEHRVRVPSRLQGVGQVGEGVPRRGKYAYPHNRADVDDLAVGDRYPLVGHRVRRVHMVGGTRGPGQRQAAGHVVVVDVGLEDVGDPHPTGRGQGQHAVDVPLRVDDERDFTVVRDIAAITERGRVDGDDFHPGTRSAAHPGTSLARDFLIPLGVSTSHCTGIRRGSVRRTLAAAATPADASLRPRRLSVADRPGRRDSDPAHASFWRRPFCMRQRNWSSPAGRPAAAAAGLLALNPNLLYLQSTPMNEPVFLACFMALLYFTVRFERTQSMWLVIAAGLAALAGTLTRYDGWLPIPFVAVYFLAVAKQGRSCRLRLFSILAILGRWHGRIQLLVHGRLSGVLSAARARRMAIQGSAD